MRLVDAKNLTTGCRAPQIRPNLYRAALRNVRNSMPGGDSKPEGSLSDAMPVGSRNGALYLEPDKFIDGRQFDPDKLDEYFASFEIKGPYRPGVVANFA